MDPLLTDYMLHDQVSRMLLIMFLYAAFVISIGFVFCISYYVVYMLKGARIDKGRFYFSIILACVCIGFTIYFIGLFYSVNRWEWLQKGWLDGLLLFIPFIMVVLFVSRMIAPAVEHWIDETI